MDTGRDQFKPGPRRGAAGGLGGFEVLGAVVFLGGCLPAAALAKAAARGTDLGAEGLGGAARLASSIAGWVGLWPGIAIGVLLAIVGAVMVVGGARRDPLRAIAGVVVSGMCGSAMASAASLGAGGLVGDASGGAIAQSAGVWGGVLVSGAVLLFSLWLSFAPERDRTVFGASAVRRRGPIAEAFGVILERLTTRRAGPAADDESVGNRGRRVRKIQAKRRRKAEPATLGDALASGSTEGVSHDEAAALAPDDSTLAYMEDVWRRASESYSQAAPVPPSPYPADVRLQGEIPPGATPFDPSKAEETAAEALAVEDETAKAAPAPSILPVEQVPEPRPAAETQFDHPTPEVAPFDFADELSAPVPLTEGPASGASGPALESDDDVATAFRGAPTDPVQDEFPEGVSPLAAARPIAPEQMEVPGSDVVTEPEGTETTARPVPSWERGADDHEAGAGPIGPADIAEVDALGHWARRDDVEESADEPVGAVIADVEEDEPVEFDVDNDLEPSAALLQAAAEPGTSSAPASLFEAELTPAQEADEDPEGGLITVEEALGETSAEEEVELAVETLPEEEASQGECEDAGSEEYEYVDEDGNPISPEDLAGMEVAKEEDPAARGKSELEADVAGDAEEAELEEGEDFEYVDEDGNPVDPEVLDGEWEVFEEDEEEAEDEEAEASAFDDEDGEPEDGADDEAWEESDEWEEWDEDEAATAEEDGPEAADEPAASEEALARDEAEPMKVLEPQAPPADTETGRVRDAGRLVLGEGRVAVSLLQREMDLAFDEACEVLDELQSHGLIGPYKGGKARDILLSADEWEALFTPSAPR